MTGLSEGVGTYSSALEGPGTDSGTYREVKESQPCWAEEKVQE